MRGTQKILCLCNNDTGTHIADVAVKIFAEVITLHLTGVLPEELSEKRTNKIKNL